jgi:hypothetical protein
MLGRQRWAWTKTELDRRNPHVLSGCKERAFATTPLRFSSNDDGGAMIWGNDEEGGDGASKSEQFEVFHRGG